MIQLFSSLWLIHPAGMGFDFIVTVPLLPSHLFFVFGCRISFLVGCSVFVDGCSAVSCDFVVFMRGVSSHPSTLPSCSSPSGVTLFFKKGKF